MSALKNSVYNKVKVIGEIIWLKRNLSVPNHMLILVLLVMLTTVKQALTAAITAVLATKNNTAMMDYDQIDNAPEEKERGLLFATSHVEV